MYTPDWDEGMYCCTCNMTSITQGTHLTRMRVCTAVRAIWPVLHRVHTWLGWGYVLLYVQYDQYYTGYIPDWDEICTAVRAIWPVLHRVHTWLGWDMYCCTCNMTSITQGTHLTRMRVCTAVHVLSPVLHRVHTRLGRAYVLLYL